MSTQAARFLTPEQYLENENKAQYKSEYVDGEVFAMAGASPRHARLITNIVFAAEGRLRDRGCTAYANDLRLRIAGSNLFTYPDVMIVCGDLVISDIDSHGMLNPTVIFEVLSPSTEAWDRGKKFAHYRNVPSLREYVLVSQDGVRVEHFARQADGQSWTFTEATDTSGALHLASVGCEIPVSEIYHGL